MALRCSRHSNLQRLEVEQLVKNALLHDPLLVDKPADRNHSKTPVLDLIELVLLASLGVLREVEWVERVIARLASAVHCFPQRDGSEDFEERAPEENLAHTASPHEVIVRVHCELRLEVRARQREDLLDEKAERGKHADAAVLELSLTQPLDVERTAEPERVESYVAAMLPSSADGACMNGIDCETFMLHFAGVAAFAAHFTDALATKAERKPETPETNAAIAQF
eukprot:CAMPEP_0185830594 /NCGR_PEP_ID=MMETSP1353-20130828/956_1 /TAXON_ID=1077150 /ORGANISM="Erythrolobus australicus, Strain CCMP3124" /LENGTH=224 /DNA_ID=CAMNT_0028528539 /DNA_START=272 /DNA_END=947 /DNA_ORIENTATION=+